MAWSSFTKVGFIYGIIERVIFNARNRFWYPKGQDVVCSSVTSLNFRDLKKVEE